MRSASPVQTKGLPRAYGTGPLPPTWASRESAFAGVSALGPPCNVTPAHPALVQHCRQRARVPSSVDVVVASLRLAPYVLRLCP